MWNVVDHLVSLLTNNRLLTAHLIHLISHFQDDDERLFKTNEYFGIL